ncbi:hypothetical protein JOQ06_023451 [Pogonophryne albipinna]|uniref:DUF4371 domain-containing protein n=1 Tax=Pogonophryne albipinna TaxID=1090488 RepID=A0AAD6BKF0_9TELE|nr:hypothetical protein JOQ06_023451 [Pogonophryne albipinna]
MAEDVKNTLIERIKSSSYYSIQLDETTDVADLANLMVYVRYEHDGAAQEDFLFCQPLETRTTAEHIFQLLDAFVQENGLEWKKCVGVCTDGARAMTGRHSGVAARIKEVVPEMRWTHGSIHREALAVEKMPDGLKSVLDSAVKSVNLKGPTDALCTFSFLFATTCLCEKGFSSLVIKTKYRSRLNAEPDLRLKLTSIAPDIKGLCSRRQVQPSH